MLSICFCATCVSWTNSVGKLSLIGHPCYHVHCTLYSCKSPNIEFNVLIYDSSGIPCPKTGAAHTLCSEGTIQRAGYQVLDLDGF